MAASPDKRTEVFVSATSGDLRSVRALVKEGLLTMGCYPVEQTNFPPDYRSVLEMLEEKIASCDAVIHIVGCRYGAEPDPHALPEEADRKSYTQLEADMARRLKKKLFVFFCPDDFPYDEEPDEEPEDKRALQRAYRIQVAEDSRRLRNKVHDREDVARQVRELQLEIQRLATAVSSHRRRIAALCIAGVLALGTVGAGLWLWVPHVIEESQKVDEEGLRANYRRLVEKAFEEKKAEAEARGASWREIEQLASARDQQLAEVEHSVEAIRRAFAEDEANPVYRDAVKVLDQEGPEEMLAFLRHRGGDISAMVESQKNRRDREEKALRESLRPWLLEGDALEKQLEWDTAIAKFEQIVEAAPQWTEPSIRLAILLRRRGIVVDPELGNSYLERAVRLYRFAAEEASREGNTHLRAEILNNVGTVFSEQGIRGEGESSRDILDQAIQAYRDALSLITPKDEPQLWAIIQNNLGSSLEDLSLRVEGGERATLLQQAETAFEEAFQVRTREKDPDGWAKAQNNLALVYLTQSDYLEAQEARDKLVKAEAAFRKAQEVYTRESFPEFWSAVESNRGNALLDQGRRASDEGENRRLIRLAIETYQNALEERPQEVSPQPWAASQTNLGNAYKALADRSEGKERQENLERSVAAYHRSLEVRTREELPQDWAVTMNSLGNALKQQAYDLEGEERKALLKKVEQAYRSVLEERSRESLPSGWAMAQNNLAVVLVDLAYLEEGEPALALVRDAVQRCREALEVRTKEADPLAWAQSQHNLGIACIRWAALLENGEEKRQRQEEAVSAYRKALEVRTPDGTLRDWENSQNRLCHALVDLGRMVEEEEKRALFQEAAKRLEALRTHFPEKVSYYSRLGFAYHELLFEPEKAFVLHRSWLAEEPDSLSAQLDFTETHLTTGRLKECVERSRVMQDKMASEGEVSRQASMLVIEVLALSGGEKETEAAERLKVLADLVRKQEPDFRLGWVWGGTRHFVETSSVPGIAKHRAFLLALIDAAGAGERDEILPKLKAVKLTGEAPVLEPSELQPAGN